MADPIIPGGIRAQVVFPGTSGLPEDRYVTTWAFSELQIGTTFEQAALEVSGKLSQFYDEPVTTTARSVASYMSNAITWSEVEVRCYDLGEAPPREPIITTYAFTPPGAANGLPEEVAVCLSFYASRNIPRARGRVYIGPLLQGASFSGANGRVVPQDTFITTLIEAAARLRQPFEGEATRWCVLSQADAELKPVTAGWVDDAFDTQRRRGREAINRTTFPPVAIP